jgi:hypothetical protein
VVFLVFFPWIGLAVGKREKKEERANNSLAVVFENQEIECI